MEREQLQENIKEKTQTAIKEMFGMSYPNPHGTTETGDNDEVDGSDEYEASEKTSEEGEAPSEDNCSCKIKAAVEAGEAIGAGFKGIMNIAGMMSPKSAGVSASAVPSESPISSLIDGNANSITANNPLLESFVNSLITLTKSRDEKLQEFVDNIYNENVAKEMDKVSSHIKSTAYQLKEQLYQDLSDGNISKKECDVGKFIAKMAKKGVLTYTV